MLKQKKRHPVYCQMVFGAPGCGKTTYAARAVRVALEKYDYSHIYCNVPIRGAERIAVSDIGVYDIQDSLVIIDEAGIDISNRSWKGTAKTLIDFLKLHRHYRVSFVFLSQSWSDCDKKIRDLCTDYRLLSPGPFGITFVRKITKICYIEQLQRQIIDGYDKIPLLRRGLSLLYRPRYYCYFDSWATPPLPPFVSSPW